MATHIRIHGDIMCCSLLTALHHCCCAPLGRGLGADNQLLSLVQSACEPEGAAAPLPIAALNIDNRSRLTEAERDFGSVQFNSSMMEEERGKRMGSFIQIASSRDTDGEMVWLDRCDCLLDKVH